MTVADPDVITIDATLTADDYRRYAEIVGRRQSDWIDMWLYAAGFLTAIPVALICRLLALDRMDEPADADLVGKMTLLAFMLGAVAMVITFAIRHRRLLAKNLNTTINAFGQKTATLDADGVTLTGQIAQASWRWAAITDLTIARDLLLIWVGSSVAMIVPARHFQDDAARNAAIGFIRARMRPKD